MTIDSGPYFSEACVEPYRLEWGPMHRVRFFIMGVLQPAICFAYPLICLGPRQIWNITDELIDLDDLWNSVLFIVIAVVVSIAIAVSSGCLAVCCVAPESTRNLLIRRGLDAGLWVWLLVFIGTSALTWFFMLIPAVILGGILFVALHWMDNYFSGRKQLSIWRIMKLTFWVAIFVFAAKTIPTEYWASESSLHMGLIAIVFATPGMACFAFTLIVKDVNYVSRS